MAIQLGTCSRLCARISAAQCKATRQRGTFACNGCPGLTDIEAVAYVPVAHTPEKPPVHKPKETIIIADNTSVLNEEETVMAPSVKPNKKSRYVGTCSKCKRPDLKINGKAGICSRCYWRIKNGKDPLVPELPKPALSVKPTPAAVPQNAVQMAHNVVQMAYSIDDLKAAFVRMRFNASEIKSILANNRITSAASLEDAIKLALQWHMKPCDVNPATPAAPPPSSIKEPVQPATAVRSGFLIDPVQCIDSVWASTRERWIRLLSVEEQSPEQQLMVAARMIDTLREALEY